MTLAHILDALDHIATHEHRLRQHLPELNRRARISSRRDGYSARASGAGGGSGAVRTFTLWTIPLGQGWWGFGCSCGLKSGIHPSTLEALEDGQRHHLAAHSTSAAVDYADPTGTSAEANVDNGYKPDPVDRRYRRAERLITQAERLLTAAVAQLTEPTDVDDNLPWCQACATIRHPDGTPHLTPPDSRVKGATTVNSRLKEPMILCSWHYDYVRNEGALPPRTITAEYVTKGRAPRKQAS